MVDLASVIIFRGDFVGERVVDVVATVKVTKFFGRTRK